LHSSSTIPDPSPTFNFLQDEQLHPYLASDRNQAQGGILALYTRPAASTSTTRPTHFFTFDVHSYWKTDYEPVTCRWLFEPRRWDVDVRKNGLKVEAETEHVGMNGNGHVNGNGMDVDTHHHVEEDGTTSSAPNGLPNGDTSEPEEASAKFFRRPFCGPKPVIVKNAQGKEPSSASSAESPLGFVVLFANHHLNFYSALHALPLVNNGMGIGGSGVGTGLGLGLDLQGDGMITDIPTPSSPRYPKLEVMSCPLLTPSTVMAQPSPGSSSSLNLDGSVNLNLNQGSAATADSSSPAPRLIVPGQATIDIRPGDETIWVGFRSYRPRRVWVIDEQGDQTGHDRVRPDAGTGLGDKAHPNDAVGGGRSVSSSANGVPGRVLDTLRGMGTAGEVEGEPRRRVGVPPRSVFRASDKEGQEEDWVEVVEVKLDLHENVFCKSIRVNSKRRYTAKRNERGRQADIAH
jgi:hypothetical protein